MEYRVVYDFTYQGATTYGCIKRFDDEVEAREWIEENKDDPYLHNFEMEVRINEE